MHISPITAAARSQANEMRGLNRALDEAYARLRERARAEWLRHYGGKKEPADARVSVTVRATQNLLFGPGRLLY